MNCFPGTYACPATPGELFTMGVLLGLMYGFWIGVVVMDWKYRQQSGKSEVQK